MDSEKIWEFSPDIPVVFTEYQINFFYEPAPRIENATDFTRLHDILYDRLFQKVISGADTLEKAVLTRSVEIIDSYAFAGCHDLKEVILPDKLQIIKDNAFYACTSLKELSLPQHIRSVDRTAFCQCDLTLIYQRVRFRPDQNPEISIDEIIHMIAEKDFSLAMPENEKFSIIWQMFINAPEEEKISDYIYQHCNAMLLYLLRINRPDWLEDVLGYGDFITLKNIDFLIQTAIQENLYDMQGLLINYKHKKIGYTSIEELISNQYHSTKGS